MNEYEQSAEFNALLCEAQALLLEADAMKISNAEKKALNKALVFSENDFMRLVTEIRGIAEKFRNLEV